VTGRGTQRKPLKCGRRHLYTLATNGSVNNLPQLQNGGRSGQCLSPTRAMARVTRSSLDAEIARHASRRMRIQGVLNEGTFGSQYITIRVGFSTQVAKTSTYMVTVDQRYIQADRRHAVAYIVRHALFHRRTRASYVYNGCLAWYNVVLTHGSTQA